VHPTHSHLTWTSRVTRAELELRFGFDWRAKTTRWRLVGAVAFSLRLAVRGYLVTWVDLSATRARSTLTFLAIDLVAIGWYEVELKMKRRKGNQAAVGEEGRTKVKLNQAKKNQTNVS